MLKSGDIVLVSDSYFDNIINLKKYNKFKE